MIKSKTIRYISTGVLAAFAGLTLAACTTVVREPQPSVAVVKDRTPDVVVVPQ